mgnify:FL=1
MKNWKKYVSLVMALVLCLMLTACGGGDDGGDGNNDVPDTPDTIEDLVKDSALMADLYVYGGAWAGEDGSTMLVATSEGGDEVRFALYDAGEALTASGFIQSVPEYDYDYFYNEHDGVAYRCWSDEVGALHVAYLGTFSKMLGDAPGENIGDTGYEALEGVWYLDGEAGAASCIEIDQFGNWTLYERVDGDDDMTEVDYGTLDVNPGDEGQYYATSTAFDDVVYDLTVVDDSVMYWGGENDYYAKMA